jgi:hypothetical protein
LPVASGLRKEILADPPDLSPDRPITPAPGESTAREPAPEIAQQGLILRTTVGSVVCTGSRIPAPTTATSWACAWSSPEFLLGFRRFEHFVHRTQPEGQPSGPGDLDLTVTAYASTASWR